MQDHLQGLSLWSFWWFILTLTFLVLLFCVLWVITLITVCIVTYHYVWNMVMTEATAVLLQAFSGAVQSHAMAFRADSRFEPSHWEMALLCNDVSQWLCVNLESAMALMSTSGPVSKWSSGRQQVQGFHTSYPNRTNSDPVKVAFSGLLLSRRLQQKGFAGYT